MILARRSFLTGLVGVLAAPAIVRAESLMKVVAPKLVVPEIDDIVGYRWVRVSIPQVTWRMYNQSAPLPTPNLTLEKVPIYRSDADRAAREWARGLDNASRLSWRLGSA